MRMFCTCLCFVLTVSGGMASMAAAPAPSLADKHNALGFKVFAHLASAERNLVFSPHGLSAVLSMAQLGATGTTGEAMKRVMGYSLRERGASRQHRRLRRLLGAEEALRTAGAVALERTMSVEKAYRRALSRAFGSHPLQVDFGRPERAAEVLNAWVSDHTEGAVPALLAPGSLSHETRLVLLDALHFRGLWKVPFDPRLTRRRIFRAANGSATPVDMMTLTGRFNYGEFSTADGEDYDVVELPYRGHTLSVFLASPFRADTPLSALAADLGGRGTRRWTAQLGSVRRQLSVPRFAVDSELSLKTALTHAGLANIFNAATADFGRVAAHERLCVSDVLQTLKFEVDERGTEGAAATAAVTYSRMAVEELTLDGPFLFLVRHKATGAILFMGQLNHPS
ncbi:plasminogen activator inhibitor 1 [Stigmatopora nigra]